MSLLMDLQSNSLVDDLTALMQKSLHPLKKTNYVEKISKQEQDSIP